jgi:VanZ family protein
MRDRWLRSVAFGLAVLLSIFVLFRPGGVGPLPFPHFDKVVHATTFALLAVTAWFRFYGLSLRAKRGNLILLCLLAYAIGSELIQHFWIPGRTFDLLDILADMVGALIVISSVHFLSSRPKRRDLS